MESWPAEARDSVRQALPAGQVTDGNARDMAIWAKRVTANARDAIEQS